MTTEADPGRLMAPLFFSSRPVERVWGGRALGDLLGHRLPTTQPYGESWDLCGLPGHSSVVVGGPHQGTTLAELWNTHRQDLDPGLRDFDSDFPLLIKWLDCRDLLSVQVHPDDAMAREVLNEPRGKTEVWIVLHAEPTARIYAGLRPGMSREIMLRHIEAGTVEDCLHSFIPQAGDCVLMPAGTVHAAGGGLVIAEIQQSSDATFRLFDWNRLGLDGKPRPLQIENALRAIDWQQGAVKPAIPRCNLSEDGVQGEFLTETPSFRVDRYTLKTSWTPDLCGEVAVWMVLDGTVRLTVPATEATWEVEKGRSFLVPATVEEIEFSAVNPEQTVQLLGIRVPRS